MSVYKSKVPNVMADLINLKYRSDSIGALMSTLCFVHCLATPFVFVAQAGLTHVEEVHPWWWGTLDIFFLVISFFAVYWSAKNTSKQWMVYAFWTFWGMLAIVVMNEKLGVAHLAEEAIYPPTLGLVALHFYNRRYCRCEDDNCCVDTTK